MDNIVTLYMGYNLLLKKKEKSKNRKFWVHPLLSTRLSEGAFTINFHGLRRDPRKFFNYFRMTISAFDELITVVGHKLTKMDTNMRKSITPVEKLAVTLRYLGSGCTFTDLHYSYKLGTSTIALIIREVCKVIWDELVEVYMPSFTEQYWQAISTGFEKRANFPNCLGAVDGKHIRMIKPTGTGSQHYNYKHYFSIVLLAVVDSDYKFMYADVGSFGKDSDSTIFKNSSLWTLLALDFNDSLHIPKPSLLPNSNHTVPYVFVGDEAFGLSKNVLRPYAGRNLSGKKKIFNYRLSRARRYVECAFGILSNKWRIFHRPLNVTTDLAVDITKACCVLHNYVREKNGYIFQDTLSIDGFDEIDRTNNYDRGSRLASDVRNTFADYFQTVGAIPWQYGK